MVSTRKQQREGGREDNKEKSLVSRICGDTPAQVTCQVYDMRHSLPRQETHEIMGGPEISEILETLNITYVPLPPLNGKRGRMGQRDRDYRIQARPVGTGDFDPRVDPGQLPEIDKSAVDFK